MGGIVELVRSVLFSVLLSLKYVGMPFRKIHFLESINDNYRELGQQFHYI